MQSPPPPLAAWLTHSGMRTRSRKTLKKTKTKAEK
jgi:hypothetical protein